MSRSALLRFVALFVGSYLALTALPSQAQERDNTVPRVSPNATISQTIGITDVEITYGRPSVRGRDIFGGLVPFDEVWRTGANEATTISFSTPVELEGEPVEAGTYALFTIPGPDTWTLILNEEANQWGAYNYDSAADVLRVDVSPTSASSREQLTFSFHEVTDSSATVHLHWATTRLPFEITVDTKALVRERAATAVAETDDWQTPLQYARYALQNEVLLEEALQWVDRSIEREERFRNLRMKAYLLAATGQHDAAVDAGETALDRAEAMDETPNGVDDLRSQIDDWTSTP